MTTPRLLAAVYLTMLAPAIGGDVPRAVRFACLAGVFAIGELWLRALVNEMIAPLPRFGVAAVAGLVSLPLVAIALHLMRVPIASRPLAAALTILATTLAVVALLRAGRVPADPRAAGTLVTVAIPACLALGVSVAAVSLYAWMPHPPRQGYTSLALNGWAATLDRPVRVPARGVYVPIRLSSAGEPAETAALRVRVGDRTVNARRLRVEADTTRSVDVFVPAPPDGCLHRIEISVGPASTVFYGRGPARC
ncbi:hypothetical protein HH310_18860 [Actinoplanes sp. TBRC 11911]|uniref:hypothetical protein n=1 Tax=Actinoplanes sp. TBRC 11911 TaxID=2729386 RepID=UPI00145EB8EE|nr:hypothetical protein [Actinoplanes sp. TBRC 11911]NMO53247.1 hypothetical protein [Actinoplanes sp. TBRC 11911]